MNFIPIVPSITVQDAAVWLKSDKPPCVVDVREPHEFALGHLKGAQLMPLADLVQTCQRLPKDQPLLIYCHHGVRGAKATALLIKQGFEAKNLIGGTHAWSQIIDPSLPVY